MSQLVTRVNDELLAQVDQMVAEGALASRSEAVRAGLQTLVDRHRREVIGRAIVDGYRDQPQTAEELAGLDEATNALVSEEPW
ncbi:MAG TPA: ribbon-helix-helix domain-containing protein [Chloroflexota bacterium]